MAAAISSTPVDKRAKEIETEYLSSLADLNVNSKPLINMLTLLADDNLNYAQIIVGTIEKHLAKVEPDVKLPLLYLVDSIVKNVGKEYQSLFSQVIVSMFCGVFETVNERVREKMFSLRQTWNDVFPQSKLYALDIKVNAIDPGWPITAQIKSKSPAIHVNPMFLKNKVAEPNMDMQQQLRDKQRELLELQAKKLELELLATKKRIEEQEKQLILQTASVSKEPATDAKRTATAARSTTASGPAPRGRIAPPNPAMLNLVKSRDPRLARQQAQMAAQMAAASTNSTPTVVSGVQIPHQPVALDPSGKPLSIRERLGRIPKRIDPRLKAQTSEGDQKKPSSTNSSSSITSTTTSHKSRAEYEIGKKRDRKDESKASKSSSSKSSSLDKKKASSDTMSSPKSTSPLKKKSTSVDKSPSRGEKISPKTRESSSKSGKSSKTSNRRAHESSNSSDNSSISPVSSSENLVPVANDSKDVDLRLLIPEKKLKLDQPPPPQQAKLVSKPLAEQKKILEEALEVDSMPPSKDVDLRIPPPSMLIKTVSESNNTAVAVEDAISPAEAASISSVSPLVPPPSAEVKKRPSNNNKHEEPSAKKSKSEKIDILFGAEDVDLRKLTAPMSAVEMVTPLPPPPPIISDTSLPASTPEIDSSEIANPVPSSKAALEAVRAKIAEATKKDRDKLGRPLLYNKLPDDPAERRRSFNQPKTMDVDLRQQAHLQPTQSKDGTNDDTSQDGMNANIKTIIAQAQEQMEKGEITPEQYNILMKQVIQLNETQKIRQAQRMEMMKRNHASPVGNVISIDETTRSPRDDMTTVASPKDDGEPKQPCVSGGPNARNDFRGKIAPMEAKPSFPGVVADLRQRDPRRVRESRFNQPLWGNRGPVPGPGVITAPPGPVINHRPPGPILNPWEQPPFPVMDTSVAPVGIGPRFPPVVPPTVSLANGPPAQAMVLPGAPKVNESVRTINIDGIQREIRFYDDIAVIFMSWDEPKEIGFQKGSRMVSVDDRDSFELSFNECYKAITIDGKVYQMKLGAPTRELYIDSSWYECYFGDPPTTIILDGIARVFNIGGPAPQVKIGKSRNDLVAGKINMIVNAETIIPVFLDSQIQMIEIHGQMHKLQFADFLLTVLINDQPFLVEYGGLPKVFKLRGKDYYIRFTAVPKLVVPGRVYIRDMIRTPLHRDLRTPPRDQSIMMPFVPPISNIMTSMSAHSAMGGIFPAAAAIPPPPQAPIQPMATGLDYLTNLMPHASSAVNVSNNLAGYQIQNEDKPVVPVSVPAPPVAPISAGGVNLPILQNINIDELYKKIVAAGILAKSSSAPLSTSTSSTSVSSKLDKVLEDELDEIEPVLLGKPDTLKRRQSAVVAQLFCGMQCSSCGVRFPPEQTMKYSQHLDWHFRQNRRDRDSARKAHSRKWYYDVSDWIQYEEIEDLEEREKNWFETQQTEQNEFNGDGEQAGRAGAESPLPSCPAGSDDTDKRCHMCHDDFEQFYNEETEEWHLKNAIRVEDNTYHPLCYEDYKASLTLDESAMNTTSEAEQSKVDDSEEVKIKQEVISDADDTVKEITIDDDDDVIVLPPSEEVVTEIPDDDDIETLDSHSTADGAPNTASAVAEETADKKMEVDSETCDKIPTSPPTQTVVETRIDDDLAIQEPTIENITVNDLDESEETSLSSRMLDAIHDETSQIKVKEEPKDDDEIDEEDALFEDVGTIESSLIQETPKELETVDVEAVPSPPTTLESTSQSQLKPSIDGNLDMQDTPGTAVITNRIKINITKAKTTIHNSSNAAVSSTTTNSTAGANSTSLGSSIAVLISGGSGGFNENGADDLLYGNLDDVHGNNENSQNSSNQLIMMMHEEEVDDSNKKPVAATEEEQTDIAYDLKPSLQGIDFTRKPRVESGFETSGLCSIM